jgi:hypothetical protein
VNEKTLSDAEVAALPAGQQKAEPTKVHATGVSANVASVGSTITRDDAKYIEKSMSNAVMWCSQQGIVDPMEIRKKMLEAREAAKRVLADRDRQLPQAGE